MTGGGPAARAAAPRLRRASGAAPPVRVLLLHGLGCRTSMWDPFVRLAGERLEVWDIELPWHGIADGRWSHQEDNAAELARIIAGPDGVTGFDVLVAHSFSANLLLEAVTAGLLQPVPTVLTGPFFRSAADDFDWKTITYYLSDFHLIFAEGLRVGDGQRLDPDTRDIWARRLRDQLGPYGWVRFFSSYLRSPFLDLAAVTAPQLVLIGDADIAARRDGAEALAAALPSAGLELFDHCGHFPMLEQPARFAGAINAFIDSLPHRHDDRAATDETFLELA